MASKIELVRAYFRLLETFATDQAAFEPYLHPEVEQVELPNLLNRKGQRSKHADMLRRAAIGKSMLSRQSYEITGWLETTNHMAVEAVWRGTMAQAAGPLRAGQELTAYFCIMLEFKDGKIFRQRNYDCFEDFTQ